jgi:hypothetical protein
LEPEPLLLDPDPEPLLDPEPEPLLDPDPDPLPDPEPDPLLELELSRFAVSEPFASEVPVSRGPSMHLSPPKQGSM